MKCCTVNAYQNESCEGNNKCSIQSGYNFPKHFKLCPKMTSVQQT